MASGPVNAIASLWASIKAALRLDPLHLKLFLLIELLVDVVICLLALIEVEINVDAETPRTYWYLISRPTWLFTALVVLSSLNAASLCIRFVQARKKYAIPALTRLYQISVLSGLDRVARCRHDAAVFGAAVRSTRASAFHSVLFAHLDRQSAIACFCRPAH
jgi:hypothetical protein